MRWFTVGEMDLKSSVVSTEVSKEEVFEHERRSLLGGIVQSVGLERLLIDPAIRNDGYCRVLELPGFGDTETAAVAYPSWDSKTSKENRLLQRAVIATFIDIAHHVPTANPSLRLLINKGS